MTELHVGDAAPEFEATDDRNQTMRLADFRGKRVVLYFYPKDNTPGCTQQACGFRDEYSAITEKNAVVIGVSPDSARSHESFRNKFDLPFTLLVDKDHVLSEAYGVWREKKMMGRSYMGIVRSHFIIDETGKLIDVQYDVKAAQSPTRALAALG